MKINELFEEAAPSTAVLLRKIAKNMGLTAKVGQPTKGKTGTVTPLQLLKRGTLDYADDADARKFWKQFIDQVKPSKMELVVFRKDGGDWVAALPKLPTGDLSNTRVRI
jgi:hypothetical protein